MRARREYLDTFWLFFHHGAQAAGYHKRHVRSLTLACVQRVAAELERFFTRRRHAVAEKG